ncbi:glycosyltransferase family 2 protein [Pinibacter soli]|uniref:Glycosyltransferase family 2 protein n=1 Tax=Pinibacter soli TaxID=3044211 RepID=A0ABT6R882_9BACT|nr:glycosyltransferase family 2 protein [Pinibacter soli]MDI3318630.1 glycosyltransferase family 2 protein [Pinibacter soli]
MSYPKILISILNWNNYVATVRCIRSIIEDINYPADSYKLVVVDNGSKNDSIDQIAYSFPGIEIISTADNLGFSEGHNKAVEKYIHDDFDLLWVLNNDLEITKATLSSLIAAYKEHGDAIYGSISVNANNEIEWGGSQEISDFAIPDRLDNYWSKKCLDRLVQPSTYWVSTIYGHSMLIPMNIIKEVGFMDKDFFMYHEETEYCFRLLTKYKIKAFIVQQSVVRHYASDSFKQSKYLTYIKDYYTSRNAFLLGEKSFNFSKKSLFRKELKTIYRWWILLVPQSVVIKSSNPLKIREYFSVLGKLHFFLSKKGRVLNPDDYL